jgi:hypothetical protein
MKLNGPLARSKPITAHPVGLPRFYAGHLDRFEHDIRLSRGLFRTVPDR